MYKQGIGFVEFTTELEGEFKDEDEVEDYIHNEMNKEAHADYEDTK